MNELSINIDMGAANNGVFIAITNEDSIIYKNAFNIYLFYNLFNFYYVNITEQILCKFNIMYCYVN